MDANQELWNMRSRLQAEGYHSTDIDIICDNAAKMISDDITDAVANALEQARQAGQDMNAQDFLSELRVIAAGSTFAIVTDSGRTDFSESAFPMLPHLLKNAKTAKDGSRYKRIPISANKNRSTIPTSTFQATDRLREEQAIAKAQILEELKSSNQSPDALSAARFFANKSAMIRPAGKQPRTSKAYSVATEFATASSKQDSSTKWVMPAKDFDMTTVLANINSELSKTIDQIIISVTQSYRG